MEKDGREAVRNAAFCELARWMSNTWVQLITSYVYGVVVVVVVVAACYLQGAAKKTYHDKNSDFLKTVL